MPGTWRPPAERNLCRRCRLHRAPYGYEHRHNASPSEGTGTLAPTLFLVVDNNHDRRFLETSTSRHVAVRQALRRPSERHVRQPLLYVHHQRRRCYKNKTSTPVTSCPCCVAVTLPSYVSNDTSTVPPESDTFFRSSRTPVAIARTAPVVFATSRTTLMYQP